jgi:hypothetical protein
MEVEMSHPEGEGAQSGAAEGTQSGAGEATGTNGSTGTGESGEGAQSGAATTPTEAERLQQELAQQRTRTQAADKRAAEIEAQLKQLRDKDLPEAEKLKRDYEDAQKKAEVLQETNNNLALKVAFLSDNTYSWHNPERALKLVDLSQVEIQADGTVSGLKEALKALAASDPYLIKQEATGKSQEPGGTAPGNNGSSGGNKKPNASAMAARIPALQSRVRKS